MSSCVARPATLESLSWAPRRDDSRNSLDALEAWASSLRLESSGRRWSTAIVDRCDPAMRRSRHLQRQGASVRQQFLLRAKIGERDQNWHPSTGGGRLLHNEETKENNVERKDSLVCSTSASCRPPAPYAVGVVAGRLVWPPR